MPRPVVGNQKAKAASSNPISEWFFSRKERKEKEAAEAAARVTNKLAENEHTIQTILEGIDFIHSPLPAKTLEHKSNPNQRYGDLEQCARGLAQALRKNPLTIEADIRPIDEKLVILAHRYNGAIKDGHLNTAYAAKVALARGILDIRSHIPSDQPELIEQFVQLSTQYLDEWITLVDYATTADKAERNAKALQAEFDKTQQQYDTEVQNLYDAIQSDAETRRIYNAMLNGELDDTLSMNEQERTMHRSMIQQRARKVTSELKGAMHQAAELKVLSCKNAVDILSAKLAELPIPENPNQMNRYNEALDNLFQDLAKKDVELREMLTSYDEMEGRISQVFDGEGWVKARDVAMQQAQASLVEMQEMQSRQVKQQDSNRREEINAMGLETAEDLEALRQSIQSQQQDVINQYVVDEESQPLYN